MKTTPVSKSIVSVLERKHRQARELHLSLRSAMQRILAAGRFTRWLEARAQGGLPAQSLAVPELDWKLCRAASTAQPVSRTDFLVTKFVPRLRKCRQPNSPTQYRLQGFQP